MNKPYSKWSVAQKEVHRRCVRSWRKKNKEKFKALGLRYSKEKYAREKARGSKWYQDFKAKSVARVKNHRAKSASLGVCRACKRLPAPGKRMCEKHLTANNRRNRTQNVALKLAAFRAYGGVRCSCSCGCKISAHEVLSIDHIEGWRKSHQRKVNGVFLYRWLRKNGYPEGFRVLCMNCNFALGHFGYCPHEFEKQDKSSSTVPVFENSGTGSQKPVLVN